MNAPLSRPRLACRAARLWSTIAPSRHAADCPACRAHAAALGALDQALRRDASAATSAPAADFESRLLRAVRAPAAPARRERRAAPWLALATATAVVVIAFFVSQRSSNDRALRADAALIASAVQSASRKLVEEVIPTTGALVADNPMRREIEALRADARSALGFLAMNFLPTPTAANEAAAGRSL